jgi:hypothetical protein
MKTYTFIIGSTDDFESIDELMDWVEAETKHEGSICRNAQIWEFDCPADCSEEIVTMMGRGYAFSSDWCMDDTFSFVIHDSLEDAQWPLDTSQTPHVRDHNYLTVSSCD